MRVTQVVVFVVLVTFAYVASADSQRPNILAQDEAVIIYLDKTNHLVIKHVDPTQVRLPAGGQGLLVWPVGNQDRWKVISEDWRPTLERDKEAPVSSLDVFSRSPGERNLTTSEFSLLTQQLAQIPRTGLIRGLRFFTPFDQGTLLSRKPTFRRADGKNNNLSADVAVLEGSGVTIRIPFKKDQARVVWSDIPNLPAKLKDGLPTGPYTLRMTGEVGVEIVNFQVADPQHRRQVLQRSEALAELIGNHSDPLYLQVATEELLNAENEAGLPFLADALDVLESVDNKQLTPYLATLREHVLDRLQDTGQKPSLPPAAGKRVGMEEIDEARDLIANAHWKSALRRLEAIEPGAKPEEQRKYALALLYEAVILAEAGPGRENEALGAFHGAIQALQEAPAEDRFRAHNNFATFLLSRAQDRLYNHAFQMATGTRRPLLTALNHGIEAGNQARQALALADTPDRQAVCHLILARLYALVDDILHTLGGTNSDALRLQPARAAATQLAQEYSNRVLRQRDVIEKDPTIEAVAIEIQAGLAYRNGKFETCRKHAEHALQAYLQAGSLIGAENAYRFLGLCDLRKERQTAHQTALQNFQIAFQLGELLRERYPLDRSGLARAGFFAGRTYVNEKLIELLIADGRNIEALEFAELAKARTLQDVLTMQGVRRENGDEEIGRVSSILREWPENVAGLDYFLGSQRAWVFVIGIDGEVQAHELRDGKGEPINSRALISKVQRFLVGVDHLLERERYRALAKEYDHGWQDDLHEFRCILLPGEALETVRKAPRVAISPHHVLHYFPFAALVTERDQTKRPTSEMVQPKFLIDEQISLVYVPSLSLWVQYRQRSPRRITNVWALGDPEGSGLPGIAIDLANIRESFGDRNLSILTGPDAHEGKAKELLRRNGLVFFGSHGLNVADRPLEGHLIFEAPSPNAEDGYLTAAEIFTIPVHADLVVLSACYSGRADRSPLPGDDLFGMQRAFLRSGAATVVSGLWDVYDGKGPELMGGMFQGMAQGADVAEALAGSQRAFLSKYRNLEEPRTFFTHPYFWAVYNVTGDGRTGLQQKGP